MSDERLVHLADPYFGVARGDLTFSHKLRLFKGREFNGVNSRLFTEVISQHLRHRFYVAYKDDESYIFRTMRREGTGLSNIRWASGVYERIRHCVVMSVCWENYQGACWEQFLNA